MFAELGLLTSTLLFVARIGALLLAKDESLKIVAGTLIFVGALSLAVQLWIYYRRWHDH